MEKTYNRKEQKMATVRMIGGREVAIPSDSDGRPDATLLGRSLSVPNNRAIIRQTPEGKNYMVPKRGKIDVNPYDYFSEAARAIRGDRHCYAFAGFANYLAGMSK